MADWSDVTEANIIRQKAPVPNIIFDIVDFGYSLRVLRFYAPNLADFSDNQLESVAEWINKVLDELNNAGTGFKYTYEIVAEFPL